VIAGEVLSPISGKTDTLPMQFNVTPPDIGELRKMFDDAREATQTNRLKQQVDRDYYDGPNQLNSDARAILRLRHQPPIYTNRVRPAIDGILGVLDAAKVDPRAYPRNPGGPDENASNVVTKALRFIAEKTSFQETKLDCAEDFLIAGNCAAIVESQDTETTITQVRHEEFFYDPYSRRSDFKDAKYLGIAKWVDASDVKRMYPEAYMSMGDILAGGQGSLEQTWQDRPDNYRPWVDSRRQRLMLVEIYYLREGEWRRCVYCAQGVFESDVSAYRNVKTGETRCPIEAQSCYVDRNNQRYGRIRDMIPIQDEINARRSRLLHLANSRQIQEIQLGAALVDADVARQEAARADGVIPSGWQLVPTADLAAGQQLLLAESKSEIERMGPTPAVLGRQGAEAQSGRSRLVLQQAGMTELARPLGRLSAWETRVYRQMWACAQQYKTAPWFVRVTDDVRAPEFLKFNEPAIDEAGQPVLDIDAQTGMPKMQLIAGPDGQPQIDPQTGQPAMQPVQKVNNRIAEMDVDIIIDTAPDTATLAQETWEGLLSLAKEVPIGTPQFMMALEMSPLPDKARIIERLKAMSAEQQGQPDPAQDMLKQATVAKAAADIENIQAKTEKEKAQVSEIMFHIGRAGAGVVDHDPKLGDAD
jgi:hypothetical protein